MDRDEMDRDGRLNINCSEAGNSNNNGNDFVMSLIFRLITKLNPFNLRN